MTGPPKPAACSRASRIDFTFAPTAFCPDGVTLHWYEGGLLPVRPQGADPRLNVDTNGLTVVGTRATTQGHQTSGKPVAVAGASRRFNAADVNALAHECAALVRGNGPWTYDHYKQWVDACVAGKPEMCGSRFSVAVNLTETLLLGCVAQHFPGETLEWDGAARAFKGNAAATDLLRA